MEHEGGTGRSGIREGGGAESWAGNGRRTPREIVL